MENHAAAGRSAYKSGNYAEASRLLEQALASDPLDSALRLMLARSLEQQRRFDEARTQLRRVLKQPDSFEHRRLAGLALVALEVHPEELLQLLVRGGRLTEAEVKRIQRDRRPEETLLAALLRQSNVRFSDLVAAQFGSQGLPSGTDRPYSERLGMRLVTAGVITQVQLKQALKNQPLSGLSVGQQLSESMGVSQQTLNQHAAKQAPLRPQLPHTDALASLLGRWGVISPQEWQRALKVGGNPAQALVKQGACQPEHLHRARHYQDALTKALRERDFRLGEVLIDLALLERADLGIALACQVDQPTPLGELLIAQRHASPEGVLTGLMEQRHRYVAEAEGQLEPLTPKNLPAEAPPIPELPARPLWQIWGAAAVGLVILTFAFWYGLRYASNRYAWLQGLNGNPFTERNAQQTSGDVVGKEGAQRRPPMVSGQFDPMSMPDGTGPQDYQAASTEHGSPSAYAGNAWQAQGMGSASFNGMAPGWESPPAQGNGTEPGPLKPGDKPQGAVNRMDGDGKVDPLAPARMVARGPESREATGSAWNAVARKTEDDWLGGLTRRMEMEPTRLDPGVAKPQPGEVKAHAGKADIDARPVGQSTTVFRYRLGQAQFEREKYQSAWVEFQAALAADPTSPLPLYYLGRISEMRGNRLAALQYYRGYLQKMPGGEFDEDIRQRIARLQP